MPPRALLASTFFASSSAAVQSQLDAAMAWVTDAFTTAQSTGDREIAITAELLATILQSWVGNWTAARSHADKFYAIYAPEACPHVIAATNMDPKDNVDSYAPFWLWMTGFPERAVAAHEAIVESCRARNVPFMLGFNLTFGALVYDFLRDYPMLQQRAEQAVTLGTECRLPLYSHMLAPIIEALSVLRAGDAAAAVPRLVSAIEVWRAGSGNSLVPYLRCALAEAYALSGAPEAAMQEIRAARELVERPTLGERSWLPEILRLEGWLLARRGYGEEGEGCLQRALDVARKQSALSWELRIATTLAELWHQSGKSLQAAALLGPVYGRFNEGFATHDLKAARALLDCVQPASGQ